MLLAVQAKQIADLIELKAYENQYGELSSEIVRHAENGYYQLTTHLPLIDRIVMELEVKGYRVEQQQGGHFKVFWGDEVNRFCDICKVSTETVDYMGKPVCKPCFDEFKKWLSDKL